MGLAKVIKNFKHVVCAELNMGQLRTILRAEFLVDVAGINKIQGQPFKVKELIDAIDKHLTHGPSTSATHTIIAEPIGIA